MLNSRYLNGKTLNGSDSSNIDVAGTLWETSSEWEISSLRGKVPSNNEWTTSSTLTVDGYVFSQNLNTTPPLSRCFISTPTFKLYESWTAPLSASQLEQAA